ITEQHAEDPLVALDLHRTIGWTYAALSQHADAVPHLTQSVALGIEHLGSSSPDVLELQTTLADSLVYTDDLDEARVIMERVVEACEADAGVSSAIHAGALATLAEVLRNAGETERGIEMLHKARALALRSTEATSPQHRAVLSTLGRSYLELTLAKDAREVFEGLISQFDPNEVGRTASWFTARGNLAIALASEGRHAEAIPLYEEVIEQGPAVLGDMHYTVRMARRVLADSYFAEGRPDAALAISERSLEDATAVHGRGHPDELGAISNHAVLLMQLGRSEEALAFTERLAAESPVVLGPTHPRTLIALRNHAAALDNVGRDEESAAMLYEILAIQQETLGDGYFDTMVTKNNLAFLLESLGRSTEAADLMQSVIDHAGPESGMPDAARAIFHLNLGRSLVSLGEVERARDALRLARELNPASESHVEKVRIAEERLATVSE
ncbi:MAG: tetratricopeptide repeat protein, partial [Planctomycetota bacterium]